MKLVEKNIFIALIVVAFGFFAAGKVVADIQGSAHDFSGELQWNPNGEVCVVCHTPHGAGADALVPLWNHQTTQSTFTVYASPTLNASVGQPSGASKACLSCHDGTIAYDAYGNRTGTLYVEDENLMGMDLSNDHPISFKYDTALTTSDGGLQNPETAMSGLGGTIDNDLLIDNKLECSSCHDVHNGAAEDVGNLLVKSNSGSALCLTCHMK